MRLIVTDSRVQQHNLARQHPDDKVVVIGDALHGIQVTEIIDETWSQTWRDPEWLVQWWEHARCRVERR